MAPQKVFFFVLTVQGQDYLPHIWPPLRGTASPGRAEQCEGETAQKGVLVTVFHIGSIYLMLHAECVGVCSFTRLSVSTIYLS